MSIIAKDIQTHWRVVQPLFSIRNEKEYDKAVTVLNELIDEIGTNEKHPLYGLLDTLGTVIHAYEDKHHPIPECSGVEMLQFLMEEHQLKPSDLTELGTPDTVLAILEGESDLTVKHIHALAVRFQVAPAVFV
ncbi:MAG: transcriptional regulator [Candidatus Poribacteria bacterium]|nr:transcriptional regulator [Candidatus Poribacteria bacterium]